MYQIIDEINRRWRESFDMSKPESAERLRATAVLWDGEVRMANLSVICSHSVNGVAKIHSDILKTSTLKAFAAMRPEMFNNKTNGISHRRFFAEANPTYAKLVTEAIGDGWLDDARASSTPLCASTARPGTSCPAMWPSIPTIRTRRCADPSSCASSWTKSA